MNRSAYTTFPPLATIPDSNLHAQSTQQYPWSAEKFAEANQVDAQSVRARLCRTGSYFGVHPIKLANGRLAFPAVQVIMQAITVEEA